MVLLSTMDPVSAATNGVALIQISGQSLRSMSKLLLEDEERSRNICRLRNVVTSLQNILTNVANPVL